MAMAPDEILVYASTAMVPVIAALVALLVLRAVYRNSMSVLGACLLFCAAVPVAMMLSLGLVAAFSRLLHGDGILALVAAPVVGAWFAAPVALIFAAALVVIRCNAVASMPNRGAGSTQDSERINNPAD
jgi:hypothetical protein